MSHHSREPRGAHDFSSPQIRVRGANDFRHYSNQRLRLPNERPPLGPRIRQFIGLVLTLAVLGGIGVGVYYGVTLLIEEDEPTATEVADSTQQAETQAVAESASNAEDEAQSEVSATQSADSDAGVSTQSAEEKEAIAASQDQQQQTQTAESQDPQPQAQATMVSVSSIEPTVSTEAVTPAHISGAEILVERVTAEPIPSGIPRSLADGAAYDPTEPATVFTSRWPVGTTLRLTRLPGATLLTDEQQSEVVGTEILVVVRGSETSNTDLQLSPAAFDQIAFYGTERIIAVRVEVTAPPP